MFNLFKKDTRFFDLFDKQAMYMVTTANLFNNMLLNYEDVIDCTDRIDKLEHEADLVRHQFSKTLDAAFITPMDKEDLTELADRLDDIIDCIESASGRMVIYEIQEVREDLKGMSDNLCKMTLLLQKAVQMLGNSKKRKDIQSIFIEIHRIENETDEMFRKALGKVFKEMRDQPLDAIIWKELYDRIEKAVDKCEDAANVIESMVVKYA